MLRAMSEDDKPHKWSDWSEQKPHTWTQERLLDFLILVAPNQLARAAVEFEVQRRLAQRQLEAAEGLRRLTSGLRWATWALVAATGVLVIVTGLQLLHR